MIKNVVHIYSWYTKIILFLEWSRSVGNAVAWSSKGLGIDPAYYTLDLYLSFACASGIQGDCPENGGGNFS